MTRMAGLKRSMPCKDLTSLLFSGKGDRRQHGEMARKRRRRLLNQPQQTTKAYFRLDTIYSSIDSNVIKTDHPATAALNASLARQEESEDIQTLLTLFVKFCCTQEDKRLLTMRFHRTLLSERPKGCEPPMSMHLLE
mmetsp:Transcript_40363/g.84010  ORF Transcript_40363/g.84010 Transcript_40363/m.84010 type:complete len:137 (-) Transcript_40363:55-465(-)